MPTVKVRNDGNSIFVGATLCPGKGTITPVEQNDLTAYAKTPAGKRQIGNSLIIIDPDAKKKLAAEKATMNAQAAEDAEKKLRPELEKQIKAEVEKKSKAKIEKLEKKIHNLEAANKQLQEDLVKAVTRDPDNEGGEGGEDGEGSGNPDEDGEGGSGEGEGSGSEITFDPEKDTFDPAVHHLEARGGKWYVMIKEKKVSAALSKEKKAEYEKLLND